LTYYFRAYATSDAGSDYSNEDSFIPQAAPIVTSAAELNVIHNSADLGGTVVSDEGSPVTERGIVWDLNPDPEGQPTKTIVPMGSGTGSFEQAVSLPAGQTIHFEAYATNVVGTSYSDQNRNFTTLTEPTIQASNATITKFAGRSMRISWTRGNGDGSIVVIRETGTTSSVLPVDDDDYTGNPDFSPATPPPELQPGSNGNFVVHKGPENSVWVTRLNLNTLYSVAIYEYAGASPDYIQSNPALVTQQTGTLAVHNEDLRINCDDCHNHGSFNARDAELSAICETCHNPDGTNEARFKTEFANHRPPTDNVDIDFVDCGMCHEVHNFNVNDTTESFHSVDQVPVTNKSFLRANVDKYVPTATPPAYLPDTDQPYRVGPPEILADTPDRAVEGGTDAVEPSTPTQARGYCQVCHTLTQYHRSTNTAGSVQTHDGINNNSGQGTEVNCGECHEHNNNFTGVGGSQTCIECHDSIQTNGALSRRIITTEFDLQSSHITGGSSVVTQADCEVCHDFDTHEQQFVTVFDVDDATFTTTFAQETAEVPATDPGEGAAMSPHCQSCHADGNAAALAGGAPEQTPTSPFTGSQAPLVLNAGDTSLWDNAGHNRPINPPLNGCVGCHSGHGSAQNNLLTSAPVFPTGAQGSIFATDFCIKCHDSDGPSSWDIAAEFDTGTNYQVTGMNGAANNQRHDVILADQTYSSSAIGCGDCHLPHVDNSTDKVRNPETGVVLPTYSGTDTTQGSGSWNGVSYDAGGNLDPANPEGGGSVTEPDYIQFCLVCHDGTPPAGSGVNLGSSPDISADYASRGKQHGTGEGGSGSSTAKGTLKPPWTTQADYDAGLDPSAPYAALNCSTCHGPHGTGNIYNLRTSITVGGQPMSTGGKPGSDFENIVTTNYILPDNGSGQEFDVYGAWCTFCHNMNSHADVDETSKCNSGHKHGGNNF
jgi:predicted CXXCH cytochrome family protein